MPCLRGACLALPSLSIPKLPLLFFSISFYWALVRADYTIDDSNYSVLKYSENPAGPVWGPFGSDSGEVLQIRLPNGTMQTVDATQCFDGTYSYAACSASNNCAVQFSFTGSGITIYVLQAGPQGMSASLSIDSGTATTATLGAPPPPQYYIPHVVLFNVQNIPSGTHTAIMTVQDWNGGFSGMMLDYINVNQAQVAGPTSPTPTQSPNSPSTAPAQSPSSTPAPSSSGSQQSSSTGTQTSLAASGSSPVILSFFSSQSSGATALPGSTPSGTAASLLVSKKTKVAAVVGGVVGGVVSLLALLGFAFFCIRRRRQQDLQMLNERPRPSQLLLKQSEAGFTDVGADPFASSSALAVAQPSMSSRPLRSWTDLETGSTPNATARDTSNPSPSHMRATSNGNESATSSVPLSATTTSSTPQHRDAGGATAPVGYPNEKAGPAPGTVPRQDQTADREALGVPPNAVLTDQQADFVNSLFRSNVPAPVVARVLERMLVDPQGAHSTGSDDPELRSHLNTGNVATLPHTQGPTGGVPWRPTMSDFGDGETTVGTGTAPPSYDYVQAQ